MCESCASLSRRRRMKAARMAVVDERTRPLRTGRRGRSVALSQAMAAITAPADMISRQVWDSSSSPRATSFSRAINRIGPAAGMGTCGAHQAHDLARYRIFDGPAKGGVDAPSRASCCDETCHLVFARTNEPDRASHSFNNHLAACGLDSLGHGWLAECYRQRNNGYRTWHAHR